MNLTTNISYNQNPVEMVLTDPNLVNYISDFVPDSTFIRMTEVCKAWNTTIKEKYPERYEIYATTRMANMMDKILKQHIKGIMEAFEKSADGILQKIFQETSRMSGNL